MNIWILNHYATGMYANGAGRHHWFAKYLIREGHNVKIFCSNYGHNSDADINLNGKLYVEKAGRDGVAYVFIKTVKYAGNGLNRIRNILTFWLNVKRACKRKIRKGERPDIILASSVHPLTLVAGIQLKKKFGIPCICEVRDLWPETLVVYGRLKKNSILAKLLYRGERWIYQCADALIFTMEGGKDYIYKNQWDKKIDTEKIFHINNGVDLAIFDINKAQYNFPDKELECEDKYKIIYTGSINRVNNLGIILDVAKYLKEIKDIKFFIFGSGNEEAQLKTRLNTEQIHNVVFKGQVEKKYIPGIICKSDLNLIHWEMSDILQYGASYNKMFEYLAAGIPILSTVDTGKYSVLKKYNCGVEVEEQTVQAIAEKILEMKALSHTQIEKMKENAKLAVEHYNFEVLTECLIDVINYITGKGNKL